MKTMTIDVAGTFKIGGFFRQINDDGNDEIE